ncbi:MAG: OsmC family protein [Saprospiraceae bacterium]|nr:OsmC family protein [Saprospiraceae bacterium]
MTQVRVNTGTEKYRTTLLTSTHQLVADEPQPYGEDLGPNPYEFLLMAIGSCVGMTLRMYADRKGWDLQEVRIDLEQERRHVKDCEDCESEDGYVHFIHKKLHFRGDLDEKQKARLLEISERCPVQKTLLNEIKIETELL